MSKKFNTFRAEKKFTNGKQYEINRFIKQNLVNYYYISLVFNYLRSLFFNLLPSPLYSTVIGLTVVVVVVVTGAATVVTFLTTS